MHPKTKALKNIAQESPRAKQVRETNERVRLSNMKDVWRDRHARRHGGGKHTSKSEALERARLFSKER